MNQFYLRNLLVAKQYPENQMLFTTKRTKVVIHLFRYIYLAFVQNLCPHKRVH